MVISSSYYCITNKVLRTYRIRPLQLYVKLKIKKRRIVFPFLQNAQSRFHKILFFSLIVTCIKLRCIGIIDTLHAVHKF